MSNGILPKDGQVSFGSKVIIGRLESAGSRRSETARIARA